MQVAQRQSLLQDSRGIITNSYQYKDARAAFDTCPSSHNVSHIVKHVPATNIPISIYRCHGDVNINAIYYVNSVYIT